MSNGSGLGHIATKLTREMILGEPPGPRLDRWVAKYGGQWAGQWGAQGVPPFSTDISAAWTLLEWYLNEAGGEFSVHEDGWLARAGEGEEVIAPTAPEAICRAILLENLWIHTRERPAP